MQVSIFFLIFCFAILFSYFYLARKLICLFEKKYKKSIFIVLAIVEFIIIVGAFGVRFFRSQKNLPSYMHAVAWVSYTILGFISFLIVLFIITDLILYIRHVFVKSKNGVDLHKRKFLISGTFLFSAILTGKAFYNAVSFPRIKNVTLPIFNLPVALHNLKIVQITDLHIGITIGKDFVLDIVSKINAVDADIVVITGDIADGFVHQIHEMLEPLSQLKSKYGTYYVTGNHEYYWGVDAWTNYMKSIGAIFLENEHKVIDIHGHKIALAGVTDLTAKNYDSSKASNPLKAIANCPQNVDLKILLAHQPKSAFAAADVGYDIQISGHTHGGQFWPWTWIVPLVQPFTAGLTRYKNMWVYVSRGTGYWGPPARLGSPSEITVINIVYSTTQVAE